ncbi:MAG TPA: MDR family MFS transporter [Acidimicrobiales bacterium]
MPDVRSRPTDRMVAPTMREGEASSGNGERSPRQIHVLMLAVMTGMFLAAIDGTIVITALPAMVGELGNLSQAPWITVGFLLTQTIATPIIGKLSDIYGRKRTFQLAIVAFLASSVACGLAQEMTQLVVLRGIQGIGAGGLLSLPMAIVGDILPPAQRARYQGYIAGTFALASLLGPLAGGFFVDYLNWRWVFFVNLPIGAVSMFIVHKRLHLTRARTSRAVDYAGAVTLTIATTPLVIALLYAGDEYGWGSRPTVALFALAAAGAAVFLAVEHRAVDPILPLGLFSNRIVRPTMIGGFVSGIGLYGVTSFVSLFLQVVDGVSATVAGLLTAPNMLAVLIASIVSGRLIARTGDYKPYPVLGALMLALGAVLLATMDADTGPAGVSLRLALTGLGIGQIGPSITIIVQNAVDYRDLGVATAGLSFIRSLGGSIGVAVIGAFYASELNERIERYVGPEGMAMVPDPSALQGQPSTIRDLPEPVRSRVLEAFADAITHAMWIAVPVLIVTAVIFGMIPRIPLRDAHTPMSPAVE